MVTGGGDTTALVWDLEAIAPPRTPGVAPAQPTLEDLREDLSGKDASQAHRAIRLLVNDPKWAVPFLRERLRKEPRNEAREQRIGLRIAELDSNRFAVRKRAAEELEELGEPAGPALRKALAETKSAEVRSQVTSLLMRLARRDLSSSALRARRGIEVLEHIGNPEAVRALAELAKGEPDSLVIEEASGALRRLQSRKKFRKPGD
jgi:HEAT repeat protein